MLDVDEETLRVFLSDGAACIHEIEESLLRLEAEPEELSEIHRLYRSMHSLKGNAGLVGLSAVGSVAHACEDLVSLLRDGTARVDEEVVSLLLSALDALRRELGSVAAGGEPSPIEAVGLLIEQVQAAYSARGGKERETLGFGACLFDTEEGDLLFVAEAAGVTITAAEPSAAPRVAPPEGTRTAPGAARPGKGSSPVQREDFLRVDGGKVSALMDLAGELGLACAAVTRYQSAGGAKLEGFSAATRRLELLVRELQNDLSALRLMPVSPVFQRLRRALRDAQRKTGKEVDFIVRGEDTEVDKVMLDALQDPLVHALRNAIDHGIESAAERVAAGKPARGRIALSASLSGGEVTIELRDDGRGIDLERVHRRAIERGFAVEGVPLTPEEIQNFVFMPGFSTKDVADEMSGRGVGMDVLRTTIEDQLRGRIILKSTRGAGTRLIIHLPLTLAFVEAMVIRERDRLFALPIEKVAEVSLVTTRELLHASATEQTMLRVRENLVPVLWLHEFWNEERRAPLGERLLVVIVQTKHGELALPVDELVGNQQVMLKPLHGALSSIRAAAGCGMLRTGDVAIALDCDQLCA
jgi:two-component system, chemotaxis family, sensor kinase CheA